MKCILVWAFYFMTCRLYSLLVISLKYSFVSDLNKQTKRLHRYFNSGFFV